MSSSDKDFSCFLRSPQLPPTFNREETPFEALASICSVLVAGLFILTFLGQNMVIPSGSMEKTLLVGDHLLVDHITLAPPAQVECRWFTIANRNAAISWCFFKPVNQPGIDATDADGTPQYTPLVKRLIGVPGDHIHLRNGIVMLMVLHSPWKCAADNDG